MVVRGRSKWLVEIINERGYTRGAEIGAAIGLTTEHLLASCRMLNDLIIIDDWRPIPGSGIFESPTMKEDFLKKFSPAKTSHRLIIHEGVSWEMADKIPDGTLDFVFIDASHDYDSVIKDLKAWFPKVRLGGLFSGHDVHWEGVNLALKELHPDYETVGIDNVWCKIKNIA